MYTPRGAVPNESVVTSPVLREVYDVFEFGHALVYSYFYIDTITYI